MKILDKIAQMREISSQWRRDGKSVGFVPTMGYLHDGHQSLINEARRENDRVVVSIFVNPTQFGAGEDFEKYPRDLEHDAIMCEKSGADIVFAPKVDEIYPGNNFTLVDVAQLTNGLCGRSRPGHFRGVCTVVAKLFHIALPTKAYFGQKDAQQLAVVSAMVRDLNFDVEVVACPIVREPDGLAKSSRNVYLTLEERIAARVLSQSLATARALLESGERDARIVSRMITQKIESERLAKIDYVEIVDNITLQPVELIQQTVLVAVAVYFGKTRLIDNMIFVV